MGIRVPNRLTLALVLKNLAQAKVRLQGAVDHLVCESIYVNDPDGNGIEIYRDRPVGAWNWIEGEIKMESLPLRVLELLNEIETTEVGSATSWEGLPANSTLGHVHFQVRDLRTATRFYSDTLGFRIISRSSGVLFLAAGTYHHHIGVNTWVTPGPTPSDTAGLAFFELRLPNPIDLAMLADRLVYGGYALDDDWDGILAVDPFGNKIALVSAT
jgi:catechol 2,3-dioxygenase